MSKAAALLETIDEAYEPSLDEVAPKRIITFRGGKRTRKLDCPSGYKLEDNRCVKMSSREIMKRRRAAKKGARKTRGKRALIARKRARSMTRRSNAGL